MRDSEYNSIELSTTTTAVTFPTLDREISIIYNSSRSPNATSSEHLISIGGLSIAGKSINNNSKRNQQSLSILKPLYFKVHV